MRRIVAGCVVLAMMCCGLASGDVPSLINYQGKLTDAGGEPISGVKSMTFEFRDAPAAGALLGGFSEVQNVAVSDGVFNVLIGSATVGGVPQSIFAGLNVYLSVTVEGEEQTPRQRVASVGFAFKASEADHAASADTAADVGPLQTRVAALEALLASVSLNGNDITFTGVNVRIVNGTGTTGGAVNGVGNLIVGYNEQRGGDDRSGSHNIVVGQKHNFTSYGGLVAGYWNTISGSYASVSGGRTNTASGNWASVTGGSSNTASGKDSSVSGGWDNTASSHASSVSGGYNNTASGGSSSVSSGYGNSASGDWSSVSGGYNNTATGLQSSVSGGDGRSVAGQYDWRAGGLFEDN